MRRGRPTYPLYRLASDLSQERARIDDKIRALLASRDILDQVISGVPPRDA
jgi:hypothetical protein